MGKRKTVLIIILLLILSGCGRVELTDAQKETITGAEQKAGEAVSKAVDQISEVTMQLTETAEQVSEAGSSDTREAEDSGIRNILSSPSDIALTDMDGNGKNYTFRYDGEEYRALHLTDLWKIIDSYKITNESDIIIICRALSEEHPIHGRDMVSFRTPEDMAYEWLQHNMAYELLPDSSDFKEKAKDVNLDPEDQGRSFKEIYEDRTGKELTLEELLKYLGN